MPMMRYLKQAQSALSMLNPEEVRRRADRRLTVGLVSSTSLAYADMEDFLAPAPVTHEKRREAMRLVHRSGTRGAPSRPDLLLYEQGLPCPAGGFTFFRDDPDRTIEEILDNARIWASPWRAISIHSASLWSTAPSLP